LSWASPSPERTRELAAGLARAVAAGAGEALVVALEGPLGAGKTVFAKGLAEGLGLDPARVASPTFVIASEYPVAHGGMERLVHADLYRVGSAGELEAAGLRDWLEPGTLLVVEWADRLPGALPPDRLTVRFLGAPGERVLEVGASGPRGREALERWRSACP